MAQNNVKTEVWKSEVKKETKIMPSVSVRKYLIQKYKFFIVYINTFVRIFMPK